MSPGPGYIIVFHGSYSHVSGGPKLPCVPEEQFLACKHCTVYSKESGISLVKLRVCK